MEVCKTVGDRTSDRGPHLCSLLTLPETLLKCGLSPVMTLHFSLHIYSSFALLGISYADYVNIYNGVYQHESRVIAFLKFVIFFFNFDLMDESSISFSIQIQTG